MPKQIHTKPPADPDAGPVAHFAFELRTLRQGAQKSYGAIAEKSFFSKSAIWAVDQGHHLPSAKVLEAFVTQCGDDPGPWLARRADVVVEISVLRVAQEKPIPRDLGTPPPDPVRAGTVAEYIDALKAMREWSGLTYRQIGDKTRDYPRRLAASTWCGALKRGTLPSRDLVESFLRALELDDATAARWLDVWDCLNDRRAVRSVRRLRQVVPHGPVQPEPARSAPPAETDAAPVWSDIRDWVLIDGSWQATNADIRRLAWWSDRRWPAGVIALGVCTVLLVLLILAITSG